jgi:DNA gyrase subunit A
MTTKEEDEITHVLSANAHDNILFFTNKGKVYQTKVYELPEASRLARGQAIVNIINTEQDETIQSVLTYSTSHEPRATSSQFVFLATRHGTVKKSLLSDFANIRRNGLTAIKLENSDELVWARLTAGRDEIILVTHRGKSIRFSEGEAKPQGRDTIGVRGIRLAKGDFVVAMEALQGDALRSKASPYEVLVISERGIGKRTAISQFPLQKRGGQGVKAMNLTAKTGNLVCARLVSPETDQLILTSAKGIVIKLPLSSAPLLARATSGVILMRFSDDHDKLAAVAALGT